MKSSIHRPTVANIDLTAIQNNIKKMQDYLGKEPEIWAVVKADAYGHGAVPVAKSVQALVGGFCVSNLDEALELRQNSIVKPILVLSGIRVSDAEIAKNENINLTAPSLDWLQGVIAKNKDLAGLKIHVAVDTGMGRIGVQDAAEANQMIALAEENSIVFDGIFTHFATADEESREKFDQQKHKFDRILQDLDHLPTYIHSANSATGFWHREQVQSIERFGVAMYGLNPSGKTLKLPIELEPALTLTSELTHVKMIKPGDTVGYGATYTAAEDIYIGTVPIGYADGWTRDMQNFKILVNGKFCQIVGRVSMDQIMIKLDKIYPLGTRVTLIGRDGDNEVTMQDIADWRHTINYEISCLLSDRIYREYK